MKGQLWISAVLYIALGVILISLILGAGLPLINKIRDRNTILQTKNMLLKLDENIRAVANEGPGSKRVLFMEIGKGELVFDEYIDVGDVGDDKITWSIRTNNKLMEPDIKFKEGFIEFFLEETAVEGEYLVYLNLDYYGVADIKLNEDNPYGNPFTGSYSITIEHIGEWSKVYVEGNELDVPVIDLIIS